MPVTMLPFSSYVLTHTTNSSGAGIQKEQMMIATTWIMCLVLIGLTFTYFVCRLCKLAVSVAFGAVGAALCLFGTVAIVAAIVFVGALLLCAMV